MPTEGRECLDKIHQEGNDYDTSQAHGCQKWLPARRVHADIIRCLYHQGRPRFLYTDVQYLELFTFLLLGYNYEPTCSWLRRGPWRF